MPVSEMELAGVLRLCDPAQTGLVSLDYFTQLAGQYSANPEEAERLVRRLDARGRGYLSYSEFCLGVTTILGQTGDKDRMMAPSVGERTTADTTSTTAPSSPSSGGGRRPPASQTEYIAENGKSNSSRCSSLSDGESFECYGEAEMDTSLSSQLNGSSDARLTNGTNSLKRNTWLRTSLKRSSNNHENLPNRRWGSFRQSGKRLGPTSLGSPLDRSSSFNSSGRSSACDDVYSDASLEEDVLDLNHKVQMLQQQMSVLADNQSQTDERYTRAKQDNAALQARVLMLEEQLRETESRSEEKLAEQERRHRELVARVDREKQLQVENCAIRLQTLELENSSLREEASRWRGTGERLKAEAVRLEEQLAQNEATIAGLREEIAELREEERRSRETLQANQRLIEELSEEVERLRGEQRQAEAELSSRSLSSVCPVQHETLQAQFLVLKEENTRLQEAHDEMQALLLTRSVEEGRSLLTGHQSLAAELEAMSQDEPAGVNSKDHEITEVRVALKEQQEVNAQLRSYIDGILLNIVDNYPQLLEVKSAPPPPP